ncbi:hypothetical protein FOA43_002753 [Brettanomyces nanus]|uniref:NADH:flavin oxidoreductase/NADH oxidase N-terminal domain-containing protein n=1 Tax=Eeniella nana TaxID=13502 RepID=A0A875S6P9_EENNA|nr:uncharacterized protein FOA43_002753 [Brettanomyces nanus]QPG75399.1 hypothetical protein FOA43_002753 [Brettanomyces nanus]
MPQLPNIDTVITKAASHVAYFTPQQPGIPGTFRAARQTGVAVKAPKLFTPLRIRSMQLANRVGVSPMCLYSAEDGVATDYHLVHYGQYALRGPGCVIMESVAISAPGRITTHCLGIYTEEQRVQLKRIVDFYHSQNKPIGLQLCHAGMRASCLALYYDAFDYPVDNERGGWLDQVYGPSPNSQFPYCKELTTQQVKLIVSLFKEAARASIEDCGYDFIEIHAAHGFLIHQFLSPLGNKRTDQYGGSFENRTRILVEILKAVNEVRDTLKKDFPIFVRISASDNDETNPDSWRIKDSLRLAKILVQYGVDVIDVSSGGMADSKPPQIYQTDMAKSVKTVVGDKCIVAAVGSIRKGKFAEQLLQNNYCDMCLSGRGFLKEPGMVERWAEELDVDIQLNLQDGWCFGKVWDPEKSKLS